MTFFRSSSAAVSSEKNLEQNILLLKAIPAVRSDLPFACLRVGTLLPRNALVVTLLRDGRRGFAADFLRSGIVRCERGGSTAGARTLRSVGSRRAVWGGRCLCEPGEPALDFLFLFDARHFQIFAQLVLSLTYCTTPKQNLGEEQPGIRELE